MGLSTEVILTFDVDGRRAFGSFEKLEKDIFIQSGLLKAADFLKKNSLDATFFVVGKNVIDFPDCHKEIKDFEIGNHTFSHPTYLTKKSLTEKKREIEKAHHVIEDILGVSPTMFRAPDYQIDLETIEILKDMGYTGDSSLIKAILPLRYFFNYREQKALEKDRFEFPLTSLIIPFNGTTAIIYRLRLSKLILEYLIKIKKTIIINFHARDFVNVKVKRNDFLRRRDKAEETTLAFLEYLKSRTRILSFRQFFEKYPQRRLH